MGIELDNPKLLSLEAAVSVRGELRRRSGRLVLTNGCFDLLHTGHLYFLQRARSLGDCLFVGLNADASVRSLKGPTRPVQDESERAYALGALHFVDAVFLFRGKRLSDEIDALRPDVYAKAGDYTIETLDARERDALLAVGAEIRFLPFLAGYSTTDLIRRIGRAAGTF